MTFWSQRRLLVALALPVSDYAFIEYETMTVPSLKTFKGMKRDQICHYLKDQGYEVIRRGDLSSVFHQAGSSRVVRVSMAPLTASFLCDFYKANEGNPYFPKVYYHKTINDTTHLSVMEKLVSLEELAEEEDNYVRLGYARALASFAFGDDIHKDFHRELANSKEFVDTIHTLVNGVRRSLRDLGPQGECLFLDRNPDGVLFRQNKDKSYQPVLANILTYTSPSEALELECDSILTRIRALEVEAREKRKAPTQGGAQPQ